MNQIEIRKVSITDVDELQFISKLTFSETFAEVNSAEDMELFLSESYSIQKLTNELQTQNVEFYFAMIGEKVIGYLKINLGDAQNELKDSNSLEIERIYILKEFIGQKVGQILLNLSLQRAEQINATFVWLGVWEHNYRAIKFYEKNGFIGFGKHIFKVGNDKQIDLMLKLELSVI